MSDARRPSLRPMGSIFFDRVEELGDHPFLRVPSRPGPSGRDEGGRDVSWREMGVVVSEMIRGLFALGLGPGARVSLLAPNRIACLAVDVATIGAGMVLVSNRPSYSDALITRICRHSAVEAVFVEDEAAAARVLSLRPELPSLRHVIAFDAPRGGEGYVTLDELRERGRARDAAGLRALVDGVPIDGMASIEYTSGSTGEPKGVVKTNRNLVANHLAPMRPDEPLLPARRHELVPITLTLNHVLGRGILHRSVIQGRSLAMLELEEPDLHLPEIRAMQPVLLWAVPRLMVRLWDEFLREDPAWAERATRLEGRTADGDAALAPAEAALLEPERSALRAELVARFGGKLERICCTGAPLPLKILRTFDRVGFPLLGFYGATEAGPITTPDGPPRERLGNVGWPYPGTCVSIAEDGEVLVRGPAIMPEYLANPAATREVLDDEGRYHTGDLGQFDRDGCLRLVGRKKDIFNTADGSNVFPTRVEAALEEDPLVHQAVLLGDRRPFLAALVVPDAKRVAAALGRDLSPADLGAADVHALVWSSVEAMNARLEANERVRKIVVLTAELPPDVRIAAGVLGKARTDRARVDLVFRAEIDLLYAETPA